MTHDDLPTLTPFGDAERDRLSLLRARFVVTRDLFTERELRRLAFVRRNPAAYHEWEA